MVQHSKSPVHLAVSSCLPQCQCFEEYRFHPERKWRFDFALPCRRLAIEIEGGVWIRGRHTRGKGFLGDCVKYSTAAVLGWRVIRLAPQQLNDLLPQLLEMESQQTACVHSPRSHD